MTGGVRVVHQQQMDDGKSIGSYRSTHTTRSSVLERAREYNRRIDEQKNRRSKSLERESDVGVGDDISTASGTPRSQSAGRISSNFPSQQIVGNRPSTRERAMASVQRESLTTNNNAGNNSHPNRGGGSGSPLSIEANHATPRSRVSGASAYSSHVSRPSPTTPRMSGGGGAAGDSYPQQQQENLHPQQHPQSQQRNSNGHRQQQRHHPKVNTDHHHNNNNSHHHQHQQQQQALQSNRSSTHTNRSSTELLHNPNSRNAPTPREVNELSRKNANMNNQSNNNNNNSTPKVGVADDNNNQEAVVTPELLVDALSGHEDGLLAIAERLMEHYDSGYDVMGEAIIDAFADVQKLFQHVVEAAHMEGAAFEASRREEEITELRKQAAAAGELNGGAGGGGADQATPSSPTNGGGGGPSRHDEFIDQDVKDILTESIRKGTNYRNSNKFSECYQLYEQACQSASALLPVDSDHRGRLQLSIARAESMSHERACAILRYAMDDVLRSGLRAGSAPLPDPSKRADVVLTRPKGHPSTTGATGVQSSEEALNSLVEEMREVMNAPVYNNTPLQSVAKRFLAALADAQKAQQKNSEKLEQNLAKLKGDFLLARAEWEEKLNSTQESAEVYKEKYQRLKDSLKKGNDNNSNGNHNSTASTTGSTYLDHARSALASQQQRVGGTQDYDDDTYHGHGSIRSSASRAGSQAGSISSGLASHARDGVRSLVGSFACAGNNARTGGVVAQELQENRDAEIREMAYRHDSGMRDRDRRRTNDNRRNSGNHGSINMSYSDRSFSSEQSGGHPRRIHTPHSVASGSTRSKSSRSFREYSRSPQRVDF